MQTLIKITLVNTQTINTPMSSKTNKRRNLFYLLHFWIIFTSRSCQKCVPGWKNEASRKLWKIKTQSFHWNTHFFLWLRHSDIWKTHFWWLNSCVALLSPKGIFYTPNSDKQGAIPLLVSFQFFQLPLIKIEKSL